MVELVVYGAKNVSVRKMYTRSLPIVSTMPEACEYHRFNLSPGRYIVSYRYRCGISGQDKTGRTKVILLFTPKTITVSNLGVVKVESGVMKPPEHVGGAEYAQVVRLR